MDEAYFTIHAATELARTEHAGQNDKAGQPYVEHVIRVRDALREHGEEAQIAGVLHDIVEDTPITLDDLREIGVTRRALAAIDSVTRRDGEIYLDMIRRAAADPLGRLVKLADNADNSREDRLVYLEPANADFLRRRYARARAVLEEGVPA
jgi:(p)ppGpp synthase/HD superfamily hydrolase